MKAFNIGSYHTYFDGGGKITKESLVIAKERSLITLYYKMEVNAGEDANTN